MTTAQDIIQDALESMGVYAPGETITDSDAERALTVLNDMLDSWSNESLTCFATLEQSVALTVNKAVYTLGSGGDVSVRPIRIIEGVGAAYVQDSNNNNYPVDVVPRDKWNLIGNRGSTVTSNVPDMIFFDSQFPLANLNVFPTPNTGGYTLFWDSYLALSEFATLTTAVSLPPGYLIALKRNLAVEAWPYFKDDKSTPSPILLESASKAKGNVRRSNIRTVEAVMDPELVSRAAGTFNIYRDRGGASN